MNGDDLPPVDWPEEIQKKPKRKIKLMSEHQPKTPQPAEETPVPEPALKDELRAELNRAKDMDLIEFNNLAEKRFCLLVAEIILEDGPQPVTSICREAAFELNVSVETAKRYLEKYTARKAPFVIANRVVSLKPGYTKD